MTNGNAIEVVIEEHLRLARSLTSLADDIYVLAEETIGVLRNGGRLLICGNGGSAVQSQHFSGELVGRFEEKRRALSAIPLTSDIASLTAIANDFGYDWSFARQVEAHGTEGDMLYGLSTSGDSPNVLEAVERAAGLGMVTVGLTGGDGGQLATMVDHSVVVPSASTARIQEAHLVVIHAICAKVDCAFEERGGQ